MAKSPAVKATLQRLGHVQRCRKLHFKAGCFQVAMLIYWALTSEFLTHKTPYFFYLAIISATINLVFAGHAWSSWYKFRKEAVTITRDYGR